MEDGFRGAEMLPTIEELHGLPEILQENFRKTFGGRLVRDVFDAFACQRLPVANPETAEGAVAVEDQDGASGGGRHFSIRADTRRPYTTCYMPTPPMNRTRLSLFYLVGYLLPTGLGLAIAPQFVLKLLFSNQTYSDAFPAFSGVLLIGLAIVVITVILYGNPVFYRMTLMVRIVLWLGVLSVYLRSKDPFFIVVLFVLGFGILLTGSFYLADRRHL
jgi:hypothetical protein